MAINNTDPTKKLQELYGAIGALDPNFKQAYDERLFLEKFSSGEKLAALYDVLSQSHENFKQAYTKEDFVEKFRNDRSYLVDPAHITAGGETQPARANVDVQEGYTKQLPIARERAMTNAEEAAKSFEEYQGPDSFIKKDRLLQAERAAEEADRLNEDFLTLRTGDLNWKNSIAAEEAKSENLQKKLQEIDDQISMSSNQFERELLSDKRAGVEKELNDLETARKSKYSNEYFEDLVNNKKIKYDLQERKSVLFPDEKKLQEELELKQKETDADAKQSYFDLPGDLLTYGEDWVRRKGRDLLALRVLFNEITGDEAESARLRVENMRTKDLWIKQNLAEISSKRKGGSFEEFVELADGTKVMVRGAANKREIVGGRDSADYETKLTEQQLKEAQALLSDENNVKTDFDLGRTVHNAIPSAIDLVEQVGLLKLTGVVGKGSKMFDIAEGSVAPYVVNGAISFYQSFGSEYSSALSSGYSPSEAASVAVAKAATTALLEAVNPLEIELARMGFKPDFEKIRNATFNEFITGRIGATGVFNSYISKVLKEAGKSGSKESVEETLQGYFSTMAANAITANTEDYTFIDALNDAAPAFIIGAAGGSLKGISETKEQNQNMLLSSAVDAAKNQKEFIDQVEDSRQAGLITDDERTKLLDDIQAVREGIEAMEDPNEVEELAMSAIVLDIQSHKRELESTTSEKRKKTLQEKIDKLTDKYNILVGIEEPVEEEPAAETKGEGTQGETPGDEPKTEADPKATTETAPEEEVDEELENDFDKAVAGDSTFEEILFDNGSDVRIVKKNGFSVIQRKLGNGSWVNEFNQESEVAQNIMDEYISTSEKPFINSPHYKSPEKVAKPRDKKPVKNNPNNIRKGEDVTFTTSEGKSVSGKVIAVNKDSEGGVDNFVIRDTTGKTHTLTSGKNISLDLEPVAGDVYVTTTGEEFKIDGFNTAGEILFTNSKGVKGRLSKDKFASYVKAGSIKRTKAPTPKKEPKAKSEPKERKRNERKVTKEADEVISTPPKKIGKDLIRIATDNGIEVTPNDTVDTIVAKLREKKGVIVDEEIAARMPIELEGVDIVPSERVEKVTASALEKTVEQSSDANAMVNEIISGLSEESAIEALEIFRKDTRESTRETKEKALIEESINKAQARINDILLKRKAQEEKKNAPAQKSSSPIVAGKQRRKRGSKDLSGTTYTGIENRSNMDLFGREVFVAFFRMKTKHGSFSTAQTTFTKTDGVWFLRSGDTGWKEIPATPEQVLEIERMHSAALAESVVLDGNNRLIKEKDGPWRYYYTGKPIFDKAVIREAVATWVKNSSANRLARVSGRTHTRRNKVEALLRAQVPNIKKALSALVPNLEIEFYTDDEFVKLTGENNLAGDYTIEDNLIRINLDKATASTLFHEAAHAAIIALFGVRGKSAQFVTVLHRTLHGVLSNGSEIERAISGVLQDHIDNYEASEGNITDLQAQEYLAELASVLASTRSMISKPSIAEKIIKAINDVLERFIGIRPIKNQEDVNEMIDFMNGLSKALTTGTVLDTNGNIVTDRARLKSIVGKRGISALTDLEKKTELLKNLQLAKHMRVAIEKNQSSPPEVITAKKTVRSFDPYTDELTSETVRGDMWVDFPDGSSSHVIVNELTPNVGVISSIDSAVTPEGYVLRGTETYVRLLKVLLENGITEIEVPDQSVESVMALDRLVKIGALYNPRRRSSSEDYPTRFTIEPKNLDFGIFSTKNSKREIALRIKRTTGGWEQGKDGKWRIETNYSLGVNMAFELKPNTHTKLPEIVTGAEELFEMYPSLRDVEVYIDSGFKMGEAAFEFEKFTLKLSEELVNSVFKNKSKEGEYTLRSILMHEIQHAIQDIEGFASGGNPDAFDISNYVTHKEKITSFKNSIIDYVMRYGTGSLGTFIDKLISVHSLPVQSILWRYLEFADYSNLFLYDRLAGEVEAVNAQIRMMLPLAYRERQLLSDTELLPRDIQIIIGQEIDSAYFQAQNTMAFARAYVESQLEKGVDKEVFFGKEEEPDPNDFPLKQLQGLYHIDRTNADDKFDVESLERLNPQGTRYVVELPSGILKIADDFAGAAQNAMEGLTSLTPAVLERGNDYVVVEKVQTEGSSKLDSFRNFLKSTKPSDWEKLSSTLVDRLAFYGLEDILSPEFELMYGDIIAPDNWGIRGDQIVLVDAGSLIAGAIKNNNRSKIDKYVEENEKRLASQEQKWQKFIKAKFDQRSRQEEAQTSGVLQTPKEVIDDLFFESKEVRAEILPLIPNVFSLQDNTAERILERNFHNNRVWAYKIENAGDIIRELAKYTNEFIDPSYIYEKVDKIDKFLNEQKGATVIPNGTTFGPGELAAFKEANPKIVNEYDSYEFFKNNNSEAIVDFKEAYKNLPSLSEAQDVAKSLVLALLDGDFKTARKGVDYFLNLRNSPNVVKTLREKNKYRISELYEQAKRDGNNPALVSAVEAGVPKKTRLAQRKSPKTNSERLSYPQSDAIFVSQETALSRIFPKEEGEAMAEVVNRVKANIAARRGMSVEDYNKRLLWAVYDEMPDNFNSVINDINGVLVGEEDAVGDIFFSAVRIEDIRPINPDAVKSIFYPGEEGTGMRQFLSTLWYKLYSEYPPFKKMYDEKKRNSIDSIIREKINKTQLEITQLVKENKRDTPEFISLVNKLDRLKKEKLEKETVLLYNLEVDDFAKNEFSAIKARALETDDFYIKEIPEGLIDKRIKDNQDNPLELAKWELLKSSEQARNSFLSTNRNAQRQDLIATIAYLEQAYYVTPVDSLLFLHDIVSNYYTVKDGEISRFTRTDTTVNSFNSLNPMVVSNMVDDVEIGKLDTGSMYMRYLVAEDLSKKAINESSDYSKYKIKETEQGAWYKFDKGNKDHIEDLNKMAATTQGTGNWCTGGSISTAKMHLDHGDFYIHMDNSGQANLALRYEGDTIAEPPRGIANGQGVRESEMEILEDFLKKDAPNGQKYLSLTRKHRVLNSIVRNNMVVPDTVTYEDFLSVIEEEGSLSGFQNNPQHSEATSALFNDAVLSRMLGVPESNIISHYGFPAGVTTLIDNKVASNPNGPFYVFIGSDRLSEARRDSVAASLVDKEIAKLDPRKIPNGVVYYNYFGTYTIVPETWSKTLKYTNAIVSTTSEHNWYALETVGRMFGLGEELNFPNLSKVSRGLDLSGCKLIAPKLGNGFIDTVEITDSSIIASELLSIGTLKTNVPVDFAYRVEKLLVGGVSLTFPNLKHVKEVSVDTLHVNKKGDWEDHPILREGVTVKLPDAVGEINLVIPSRIFTLDAPNVNNIKKVDSYLGGETLHIIGPTNVDEIISSNRSTVIGKLSGIKSIGSFVVGTKANPKSGYVTFPDLISAKEISIKQDGFEATFDFPKLSHADNIYIHAGRNAVSMPKLSNVGELIIVSEFLESKNKVFHLDNLVHAKRVALDGIFTARLSPDLNVVDLVITGDSRVIYSKPKAAMVRSRNNRAVLVLDKHTTVAELLHELAHLFQESLTDDEIEAIAIISGVPEIISTNVMEDFADGFVRYLQMSPDIAQEGNKSKDPILIALYKKFSAWLKDVFNSIGAIRMANNPLVRDIYAAMLFREEANVSNNQETKDQIEEYEQTGIKTKTRLFSKKSNPNKGNKPPDPAVVESKMKKLAIYIKNNPDLTVEDLMFLVGEDKDLTISEVKELFEHLSGAGHSSSTQANTTENEGFTSDIRQARMREAMEILQRDPYLAQYRKGTLEQHIERALNIYMKSGTMAEFRSNVAAIVAQKVGQLSIPGASEFSLDSHDVIALWLYKGLLERDLMEHAEAYGENADLREKKNAMLSDIMVILSNATSSAGLTLKLASSLKSTLEWSHAGMVANFKRKYEEAAGVEPTPQMIAGLEKMSAKIKKIEEKLSLTLQLAAEDFDTSRTFEAESQVDRIFKSKGGAKVKSAPKEKPAPARTAEETSAEVDAIIASLRTKKGEDGKTILRQIAKKIADPDLGSFYTLLNTLIEGAITRAITDAQMGRTANPQTNLLAIRKTVNEYYEQLHAKGFWPSYMPDKKDFRGVSLEDIKTALLIASPENRKIFADQQRQALEEKKDIRKFIDSEVIKINNLLSKKKLSSSDRKQVYRSIGAVEFYINSQRKSSLNTTDLSHIVLAINSATDALTRIVTSKTTGPVLSPTAFKDNVDMFMLEMGNILKRLKATNADIKAQEVVVTRIEDPTDLRIFEEINPKVKLTDVHRKIADLREELEEAKDEALEYIENKVKSALERPRRIWNAALGIMEEIPRYFRSIKLNFDASMVLFQGFLFTGAAGIAVVGGTVGQLIGKATGSPALTDNMLVRARNHFIKSILGKSREAVADVFLQWGSQIWSGAKGLAKGDLAEAEQILFQDLKQTEAVMAYNDIISSPRQSLRDVAGLVINKPGSTVLNRREEMFQSKWADKFPVLGVGIVASEAVFTTYINGLRAAAFDFYLEANPDATVEELTVWASFINMATGVKTPEKQWSRNMTMGLNYLLIAPKLYYSFINYIASLATDPARAALYASSGNKKKARAYLTRTAMTYGVTGMFYAMYMAIAAMDDDDDIEFVYDPASPSFATVRYGRSRLDVTPVMPYLRYGFKVAMGMDEALDKPKLPPVEEKPFEKAVNFWLNKITPFLSLGRTIMNDETFGGRPFGQFIRDFDKFGFEENQKMNIWQARALEFIFLNSIPLVSSIPATNYLEDGSHGIITAFSFFGAPTFTYSSNLDHVKVERYEREMKFPPKILKITQPKGYSKDKYKYYLFDTHAKQQLGDWLLLELEAGRKPSESEILAKKGQIKDSVYKKIEKMFE